MDAFVIQAIMVFAEFLIEGFHYQFIINFSGDKEFY